MSRLIESCVCGNSEPENFLEYTHNNIPVRECKSCGLLHQNLEMTPEQYFNFYSEKYHTDFQSDRGTPTYDARYQHDCKIADIRCSAYEKYTRAMPKDAPMLDIGSSNNAFVDGLRLRGFTNAVGVEIGSEAEKHKDMTYNADLMDIHFPPNTFHLITLHDVLEHFINPTVYLDEMHKILHADGLLVIDLPNFYVPEGRHHWKAVEHLWFFTEEAAVRLFTDHGFEVVDITAPIPSKTVYYLRKDKKAAAKKVRMLFMPGMGDIYWCLTKVESFIKENNLGIPEAYIWDIDQKKIGTKQRSENFLDRFPFVEYKGTYNQRHTPNFDKFYSHKDGPGGAHRTKKPGFAPNWVLSNVEGFDYAFNVNAVLETGESIVDSHPNLAKYETNWEPTRFVSIEEKQHEDFYKQKYGKYVFCYFTGVGAYDTTFNAKLTPQVIYTMLKHIHEETGAVAVLTGTSWDASNAEKIIALDKEGIIFSEVNNTNTAQLMALMKSSVGVIGWPAGNTIVAASMFKKPTIMVWSKVLWDPGFAPQCVDPTVVGSTYKHLYIEDYANNIPVMANEIVNLAKEIFEND